MILLGHTSPHKAHSLHVSGLILILFFVKHTP